MIKRYRENEIDKLANILMNDGVIAVPTDTVYGLCVRMDSKKAREKLMQIKNRPSSKSLPVMCSDINQIRKIAIVEEREKRPLSDSTYTYRSFSAETLPRSSQNSS